MWPQSLHHMDAMFPTWRIRRIADEAETREAASGQAFVVLLDGVLLHSCDIEGKRHEAREAKIRTDTERSE